MAAHKDNAEILLSLDGVSKGFPGVRALEAVRLTLRAGEVTALIGENGAGKSTLVKILTGLYRPDAGRLTVAGSDVKLEGVRDAARHGIVAIHQETVMFDDLTVAENIFMGHMPKGRGGFVDWPQINQRAARLLAEVDADFSAHARVSTLSVAQKHLVEIARALSQEARIIIMDEPTAALSGHEITDLFKIIARLKAQGRAILFISHKFDEIFAIADSWACLRDGVHVGEGRMGAVTQADLVRLMVGRPVGQMFPQRRSPYGPLVLEAEGLSHPTEFADISFSLHRGEILGFYGLVGAGRSEVMQALFGLTPISAGSIRIDGKPVTIDSAGVAISVGLGFVPEDRQHEGAILALPIYQNVTLAKLQPHTKHGVLSRSSELAASRAITGGLDLRAAGQDQAAGQLSGGNQQKVVIAKWLATNPKILILDEPTKGIDIGAKAAVHEFIRTQAEEGMAVIMVSSEIPEIIGMADRVMVMRAGRIVAEFAAGTATPEKLVAVASQDIEVAA